MASLIAEVNFPACPVFDPGPFEYGGALFTFWLGTGKTVVQPYKSTDAGSTWTASEVGPTVHADPTPDGSDAFANVIENDSRKATFETLLSGSTVYVAYIDTSGNIALSAFDMASESWSDVATDGPAVSGLTDGSHKPEARVAFCDDGDGGFIFHYRSGSETAYARCDSDGTWTATGVSVAVHVAGDTAPFGDSVRPFGCVRVGNIVHFFYAIRTITERALNLLTDELSDARYCITDAMAPDNSGTFSVNGVIQWGNPRAIGTKVAIPLMVAGSSTVSGDPGSYNLFALSVASSQFDTTWNISWPIARFDEAFGGGPFTTTPLYVSNYNGTVPYQTTTMPSPVTVVAQSGCYVCHWVTGVTANRIVRAQYSGSAWHVYGDDRVDPVFTGYSEVGAELGFTGTYNPTIAVYTRKIEAGIGLCYIYRASAGGVHQAYYYLATDPCAVPACRYYTLM